MKPILFNTEMVKAVSNDLKTVTRRVVKPQPKYQLRIHDEGYHKGEWHEYSENPMADKWCNRPWGPKYNPPYQPGDILYVPQPWKCFAIWDDRGYEVEFQDGEHVKFEFADLERAKKWAKYLDKPAHQWQSPYFMPKEAARLFLRVTGVRVERLQDMRLAEFLAEGVQLTSAEKWDCIHGPLRARKRYAGVWNSTLKPKDLPLYGWDANPWVWVIEFERISKEEAIKEDKQ